MKRFGAEASAADSPGSAMAGSPIDGCPLPASCIPTPACALLPGPKAGARCGSSARRDLSGGPPARAVPTGLSGEGPVTGLERRGRVVLVRLVVNQGSWEEPGERIEVAGQAVCDGLAGESPAGVVAKQPRSWWPAEGETRPSKRHDNVAVGGKQVIGLYDEESCRVEKPPRESGKQAGAEPRPHGRRPWTVRRPWKRSTQEPAGLWGAERSHSPSWNRRDPSRHRRHGCGYASPQCPVAAKPIRGGPAKWWSVERKSEEAIGSDDRRGQHNPS